ncbi:MAG TPA: TadE/TadG family type IV pilus assembly protein [Gaiellales bacterium]|nr:TadE/TadG family type IV pilus assembly protein [Gaiellales bacterium]
MERASDTERGQASIETVVLLPVLVAVTFAVWQAALAGWTLVSAESAARAAARAALAGSPTRPAALAALPESMRRGARIDETGGTVTVRVRIPAVLPGFDADLSASAAEVRS